MLAGLWTKTILRINFDLHGSSVNAYHYLYKTIFVPIGGDLNGSSFAFSHLIGLAVLLWMYKNEIKINYDSINKSILMTLIIGSYLEIDLT